MTTAYHGTTNSRLGAGVLSGASTDFLGLYVTDSADRAQLYADAQATREVCVEVRRAPSSAVVTLETDAPIVWSRRAANHHTLDVCEAVVQTWRVVNVTVYATTYDLAHAAMKVNGCYVPTYPYLRAQLGDRLTIVEL